MTLTDLIIHIREKKSHYEKEYIDNRNKDLTMLAYDMHSRFIALKHLEEWMLEQYMK